MRVVLVACAIACVAPLVHAQPSASEMAAARELFQSGLEHARAGRWDQARTDFERSYAIAEVPTTLLNLAGARAETGQLVAAAESYRRFLSTATTGRARRYRPQATEALAELEPLIPRVRIEIEGLREGDVVLLDATPISDAVVGAALPVDPGDHVVSVERRGSEVARESVSLMAAEERTLALRVVELMPDRLEPEPVVVDVAPDDDEGSSIVASPWLWTGVGAAVLGVVLTAVLVTRDGSNAYRGNFGSGRETFE